MGVRIAERIQHNRIEYFLFDDKKAAEVKPNLDSRKIISGYSKIIPKLSIKEVKNPKVSLILGRGVIVSDEYWFISTSNATGATRKKQKHAPAKNSRDPTTITIEEISLSFS